MKIIFLENLNIFDINIIVAVGCKMADWEIWKKKSKLSKSFLKDYDYIKPQIKEGFKIINEANNGAMACIKNEENVNYYFLLLKDWDNGWHRHDVLLHEIIHLKQFIWKAKSIGIEEVEFESYFIENTFRQLRDKLNKLNNSMACKGSKKKKK